MKPEKYTDYEWLLCCFSCLGVFKKGDKKSTGPLNKRVIQ
jgi:hypothetical protein